MFTLKIVFWILILIVFYTYLGYGIVLAFLVLLKKAFSKNDTLNHEFDEPDVTFFIPAYNESDYVESKVKNSLEIDYPKNKLHFLWITDGSDDSTYEKLLSYPEMEVQHLKERNGKIEAINRGMQFVKTPIVIFTDANTLVNKESVREIVKRFNDLKTACVSGEKRIINNDNAAGAGEGLYWKYESFLKKLDDQLYSVVGAAGELFAIRTELFNPVEKDTLLDDFMISLRLAQKGYKTAYCPAAYAMETSSANVKEELKRKIRIAAGGIQSILRLLSLLNIFKYGLLSFQYISHRVLRWTITPLSLLLLLITNILLVNYNSNNLYSTLLAGQILFYLFVLAGWTFRNKNVHIPGFFVPYYFFIMNLAVYLGFFRFIRKKQSVNWERAKRA